MAQTIRVLIVDHREVLRLGLAAMISSFPEVEWCRCISSFAEAHDLADVTIAPVDAYVQLDETARRPPPRRIAVIGSVNVTELEAAVRVETDGYILLGDTTADKLRLALTQVLQGQMVLPDILVAYLLQRVRNEGPAPTSLPVQLSPRENEVLDLLLAGLTNKQIAQHLGISIHGAKRHVSNVLNKYGAPNRSALISRILQPRTEHPPVV